MKGKEEGTDISFHPVAAIVLVGDPSFVKDLPWDRGDASKGSVSPIPPTGISYEQH